VKRVAPIVAVIAACSSAPLPTVQTVTTAPAATAPETTTAASSTPPISTTVPVTTTIARQLPVTCSWETPTGDTEITFAVGARLYGLVAARSEVRCLAELASPPESLLWSPDGERFIEGANIHDSSGTTELPNEAAGGGWTRPTGQGIFYVTDSGLYKWKNGRVEDISFLATHRAAAYHPAGTHIAVVGAVDTTPGGLRGLFLSTNRGTEGDLIAADEDAVLSSPAFDTDGLPLFIAQHSDRWDLHRVVPVPEGGLEVIDVASGTRPLDLVTPSVFFGGDLAWVEGSEEGCGPEARTQILGFQSPELGYASIPLGWVSPGVLVVEEFPGGCDQQFDLVTWTIGPEVQRNVVWSGVDAAALRLIYPDPPPPPSRNFADSTAPA